MKLWLKTLIPILCCLLTVSIVAAQDECPEDTYIILGNGMAYSLNNPDAEPVLLVSAVRAYLHASPYVNYYNPFWMDYSSATQTLAFTDGAGIFLLDADDDTPRQIPLNDTEEHDYVEFGALAWSPDGQSLAVSVYENLATTNFPTRITILLYEVAADSWREVLEAAYNEMGLLTFLEVLRWSPDGTTIAFSLVDQGQVVLYDTYLLDTACFDSGDCERTSIVMRPQNNEDGFPENRYAPSWSPDGSQLGFVCGDDLCILDRESQEVERIDELDIVDELLWLPCGNRILYQREDESFVVRDLDSGEETTLPIMLRTGTLIQAQDILAFVPMPDAAFLLETSSGA